MAAATTSPNARVYPEIGDQLLAVSGTGFPGASADMTAFRALTGMTNAGFVVIEINTTAVSIDSNVVLANSDRLICRGGSKVLLAWQMPLDSDSFGANNFEFIYIF